MESIKNLTKFVFFGYKFYMLPPRHRHAATKAFWNYWPRRVFGDHGLVGCLLICAVILIIISLAMPQFAQKTRAFVFDQSSNILTALTTPAKKISLVGEHMMGLFRSFKRYCHFT